MKAGDSVVIARVGNGYQVCPVGFDGESMSLLDIRVFQDKGFCSAAHDNQPTEATLFGWLDRHFADPAQP